MNRRSRGRPEIKPTVKLTIWVLVELKRDIQNNPTERYSERQGCERLEKHLRLAFRGGRVLPHETIRRHYKDFERLRKSPENRMLADYADAWLSAARQNREAMGWDASTWMFAIHPDEFRALGRNVVLRGPGINDPTSD